MGGNLLKQYDVKLRRMQAGDYKALADEMVDKLRKRIHGRVDVIPSYRKKKTFGDMDLLVEVSSMDPVYTNEVHAAIREVFNPVVVFQNVNSSVITFSHASFQIDAILAPSETYNFSYSYYSYNDLGNLLGRVAETAGFKLGHDGLWWEEYSKKHATQVLSKHLVTRSFSQALDFFDYNLETYTDGFETLQDMFAFMTNSSAFFTQPFHLENRNAKARARDSKRENYTKFLDYISRRPDLPKAPPRAYKADMLTNAKNFFGHFPHRIEQAALQRVEQRRMSEIFHSTRVTKLFGLHGKELGSFLQYARDLTSNHPMRAWLLQADDGQIAALLTTYYQAFMFSVNKSSK